MNELIAFQNISELSYVFAAGFVSSLTPCVYPMIPITLSIFGATGDISRSKAFLRALSYVLGIAATYTTLGIVTAKTGMVFGSMLNNPVVVIALCLFLLLLSLHTLDILTIQMSSLQSKASKVGGKGLIGAFLMGAVSGVVAAPCVGPVLVVILMKAAHSENVLWGGALLFSYSMGLGVIFLLLGTFSGLLSKLPRSGSWLTAVKFLIAAGVLMAALWLIGSLNIEPMQAILSLTLSVALLLGIASLIIARLSYQHSFATGRFVAACCLALAVFGGISTSPESSNLKAEHADLHWKDSPGKALSSAQQSNKPVMLDLYADWCAACKKLDRLTFSDNQVSRTLAKSFVPARVNFTEESEETDSLAEKYEVLGLPCVLFLTPEGDEIPGSRVTGFMDASAFLQHINSIGVSRRAMLPQHRY